MISVQLKLRLTFKQEALLTGWLWNLTGVWNWAVRKIELDAADGVYYTSNAFYNLLAGHSRKLQIPSHTLSMILSQAHSAWSRCFNKIAKKPRLKGARNKLSSIPFPDAIRPPIGTKVGVPGLGVVRFHRQELPEGKIKCGRIVKRASGWYLCLFIDAASRDIEKTSDGAIGIDPGFTNLLTLSNGKVIGHPRELEVSAKRLAQAQRGHNKRLSSRIYERVSNRRKDRNHKLSRQLVAENGTIVFSKDNYLAIAKKFGKSVTSSGHGQLRSMLNYKCRTGGRKYIEVPSKNSTRTCSSCGALTGPTGLAELKVRQWTCTGCGAEHDRDVNAAINTLVAGVGATHEVLYANAA